jgi:hypothetical protein
MLLKLNKNAMLSLVKRSTKLPLILIGSLKSYTLDLRIRMEVTIHKPEMKMVLESGLKNWMR